MKGFSAKPGERFASAPFDLSFDLGVYVIGRADQPPHAHVARVDGERRRVVHSAIAVVRHVFGDLSFQQTLHARSNVVRISAAPSRCATFRRRARPRRNAARRTADVPARATATAISSAPRHSRLRDA